MISFIHQSMGTVFSFLVDESDVDLEVLESAVDAARTDIDLQDTRFSLWKQESEISQFNRGEVDDPSDLLLEVISLSETARALSAGYFDPWALGVRFDPTGIVKGWAAHRALSVLESYGVKNALINAGGDICVLPGQSYDIGIRHPNDPSALCGVVEVAAACATSGVYERGQHIVNPRGRELRAVSATVLGGDLSIADALATALVAGGVEVLRLLDSMDDFEAFFISTDGSLFRTVNFRFKDVAGSPPIN